MNLPGALLILFGGMLIGAGLWVLCSKLCGRHPRAPRDDMDSAQMLAQIGVYDPYLAAGITQHLDGQQDGRSIVIAGKYVYLN